MTCTCKGRPGKFEGEPALTFMAWSQAMRGNADATTGEADERSVDWLRSPLNLDADRDVVSDALAYGYCQECVNAAGQDVRGGVAVREDGQGFVSCRTFGTQKAFDRALGAAEERDADADDDDESEE